MIAPCFSRIDFRKKLIFPDSYIYYFSYNAVNKYPKITERCLYLSIKNEIHKNEKTFFYWDLSFSEDVGDASSNTIH